MWCFSEDHQMSKEKPLNPLTMTDEELIEHCDKQVQALRMALDMIECEKHDRRHVRWAIVDALKEWKPAQQEPVAYDKAELNCFAQNLYDQKMREGKRGHYESMFHVIHQCIKKVAPPPAAQRQWVGLTEPELHEINPTWPAPNEHWKYQDVLAFVRAIEAKLKEKNT
jgi:hypothetical protein